VKGCYNPSTATATATATAATARGLALLAVIIEFWFLDGLFYYLHLYNQGFGMEWTLFLLLELLY
jgi:hypothetical protein